ncbi:MAG: LptF/LptG family permease [Pirellulaceae bacterium]|nr:LptF/LptG family permease [Pirellulaceae bacterium]
MTRLTRYIIWELLKVFVLVLLAATLLLLVAGMLQQALREGLGLTPVLRIIPFILPHALRFAVPATILFAVCTVYGRMAASNELVAIKSTGVSPWVALSPAIVLAFLLSLLSVWLNDLAVSWGTEGINRVILHSVEEITYSMLRTHRSYSTDTYSINVQDVRGRRLIWPTFSFHLSDDEPPVTLTARQAELRMNEDHESLSIVLFDSEVEWGEDGTGFLPDRVVHEIPLRKAIRSSDLSARVSQLPLHKIDRALDARRQEVAEREQALAAEAAYQMLTGDFHALSDPAWSRRVAALEQLRGSLSRFYTEPWRRWASGFSCLFFVLVGAPLALLLRNGDFWTSFGLTFLPVLLVYYPLFALGLDRAKAGQLPPFSVWLANFVLLAIGGWLLRRVLRH